LPGSELRGQNHARQTGKDSAGQIEKKFDAVDAETHQPGRFFVASNSEYFAAAGSQVEAQRAEQIRDPRNPGRNRES